MTEHKVPVQSLIDHIKTAVDVDPWAKEMAEELLKEQEPVKLDLEELSTPDRVRVVRCQDCRFWEPENAEEGDSYGRCRNDYAPCQNQQTDMNWFCADGEREG